MSKWQAYDAGRPEPRWTPPPPVDDVEGSTWEPSEDDLALGFRPSPETQLAVTRAAHPEPVTPARPLSPATRLAGGLVLLSILLLPIAVLASAVSMSVANVLAAGMGITFCSGLMIGTIAVVREALGPGSDEVGDKSDRDKTAEDKAGGDAS